MVLSYRKEIFVLENPVKTAISELRKNENWIAVKSIFSTTSLREAVRFKPYADESAEKIFKRVLVNRYPRPTGRFPKFLDPHQRAGIRWVLTRSRSYLAHAPGAGKTLQAIIAACHADGEGRALFIVPPSLVINWQREIEAWAYWDAGYSTAVIAGKTTIDSGAYFVVVADSMLTNPTVLTQLVKETWRFVAVDEASRFKEPTSQRTIALFGGYGKDFKSPGLVQRARHAVLLDGSPMPNRPMELWAPTYAMAPEVIDFMEQGEFGFEYCGARMNHFGRWEFKHATNEGELRKRLQKDFMHVVTEDQLDHPERLRSIVFTDDYRDKEVKTWEKRHIQNLSLTDIDETASQGDIAHLRSLLGSLKVKVVAQYVSEKLEKGESLLLFCWHRDVAYALFRTLRKFHPGLVMGGTPNDKREQLFASFQSGKRKIIIGNIGAMGRGHNLQAADRVVFGEYSWTDELNKQCEKRTSRKGRDRSRSVRCDYLVCPNSLDEVILNSLFRKEKTVKKIIG
jgi:SWI/SNF-related matrix-associated actin-dependent regulator 1 of chromatin subfamily A